MSGSVTSGWHGRILALVVICSTFLAFSIPRFKAGQVRDLFLIAGPTPEAAEFARSSRAMHTASGLFRVIVRGLFGSQPQPSLPGAA